MNKKTYDINALKLLYPFEIINISEKALIKVGLYEKRGNLFYDVIFELNDKYIFLGRFDKTHNSFKVKYNDGKILICYEEFKNQEKEMKIIKVLSLYEIVDDTFYSCTEEEALELFNENLDSSYLKNKKNKILRSDVEKIRRLRAF